MGAGCVCERSVTENHRHHAPQADLRWLWRFVVRHRASAWAALLAGVIGGITSSFEPFFIGTIIDHLQQGAAPDVILGDAAAIILFAVISVAAFVGQRYYAGLLAINVSFDIRRTLFDNLLTLEQAFYNRYPTGDLIARMNGDLEMVYRLLALGFTRFGSAFTALVFTFVLLASVNLPLTLVVFVVLLISTTFQIRAGLILAPVFERVQDQAGVLSAHVQDAVSGIQTLKTFGREAGNAEKYYEENARYRRQWLFFRRRNEPVGMLPNMISQLTTGIVVLFGGMMVVQRTMTLGAFAQFLIYLSVISTVLLALGTIYQRMQQARGALARITPLLQPAEIRSREGALPVFRAADAPDGASSNGCRTIAPCDIEFDHVTLVLDGATLLHDISLKIAAGQVVAFVGPTGCGKTLLVNLLARVFDPTEGRVLINGVDVRDLDLGQLREAIAYVPQSTFLFSQTLEDNIRMGKAGVDDDSIARAVEISRLSNDLPQLPHGMQTLVGEKGVMLSGGQKQRVAIARAVSREPAILVLDDALSSVDTHTAADILRELRGVLRSRTSLIIAHRIATVKDADHIVVMERGRIVEQGTHEKLIARGGIYARMVARELRHDDTPADPPEEKAHSTSEHMTVRVAREDLSDAH